MKLLIKSLYAKGTTQPLTGDALSTEIMIGVKQLQQAIPLPKKFVSIDADLYSAVRVGSIDIAPNEDEVLENGLKPVLMGQANAQKLQAKKYPTIITASKEQLRASSFEDLLHAELMSKLSSLATKKIYTKLSSTPNTSATSLGDALDAVQGGSGVIVVKPSDALKLIEKYNSEYLSGFEIISHPSVVGTHVICDDALVLSMSIATEQSNDAMLQMSDSTTAPATGLGTDKVMSMYQHDLTAFKFELFLDAVVNTNGYRYVASNP